MIDLFKIGFLTFTLGDLLDITIVTFVIYKLFTIIRGTIAAQILFGLFIVFLLSFIAQALNLKALGWILQLISDIWVIAFIILFQPEIRKWLLILGRNPIFNFFAKEDEKTIADILSETAFELAQYQHGALIIIEKTTGIKSIVETGEFLNAKLNKSLLRSIFFPRSPLHDGAVIVKNEIIEAAGCTLPLSNTMSIDGESLGMRHRAGLGISEQADTISLIVSEETGSISIAENGRLRKGLSKEMLRNILATRLMTSKDRGIKSIFEQFTKQK